MDAVAAAGQDAAAPETREVETPHAAGPAREAVPPPDVVPPRGAEAAREWTPPTREFAAFTQSLEGAAPGAKSGEPPAGARPRPAEPPVPRAEGAPRRADETSSFVAPPPPEVVLPHVAAEAADEAVDEGADEGAGGEEAGGAGGVRGRVARVREGTRARVERVRDEAIVVLEETPDDSGLRFVLAAAGLFVVFLVLLFLSTTVLR